MKKILLTFIAFAAITLTASAQAQRLSLYEEFTGENCDPCAADNPALWALFNNTTASNPSKVIDITYMEPVPSAGWFYYQDSTTSNIRMSYYQTYYNMASGVVGEVFTPGGVQNGLYTDGGTASPMNVAEFSQADIDSGYAITSPFTMSVTNTWDATYSNIITSVTITNASTTTAYAPAGANFYLRLALVNTCDFATPPGTNGESHFQNVVRAMYPNALGTALPETWAASASHTYTFSAAVPSYVDKSQSPFMVAWVQNDANYTVQQAAKGNPLAGPANDGSIYSVTGPAAFFCSPLGTYTATNTATIKNEGSATLTSATIYYQVDGGTMSSYPWSGSLATGATTTVSIPTAVPVTIASYHVIYDSLGMPNGVADENPGGNVATTVFFIENSTGVPMPYTTSLEGADGNDVYSYNIATDGSAWQVVNDGTGPSLAHTGISAALYDAYQFPSGDASILTLPEVTTTSPSAIDFYVAYTTYSGVETDKLEVVYSTNCGSSWTSLWSEEGNALATVASDTSFYIPTAASDYVAHSVSLNTLPAGSMLGFRATSNYGNNIWLDDINVHAGAPLSVNQVSVPTEVSIYPNPAKDEAVLSFNLTNASDVQIQIVDGLGRVMNVVANEKMDIGAHTYSINTSSFASGIYNVILHTDGGTFTKRLSVVK